MIIALAAFIITSLIVYSFSVVAKRRAYVPVEEPEYKIIRGRYEDDI